MEKRYKVESTADKPSYDVLEELARARGFLQAGGYCNTERMARVLLDEFRSGKPGRINLQPATGGRP